MSGIFAHVWVGVKRLVWHAGCDQVFELRCAHCGQALTDEWTCQGKDLDEAATTDKEAGQ